MNQPDRCPGCGERLVWIVTATRGRPMPCDPQILQLNLLPDTLATEADREATWRRVTVLTANGIIHRGYQLPVARAGSVKIKGRMSHYATCPKAGYYRLKAAQTRARRRTVDGLADR